MQKEHTVNSLTVAIHRFTDDLDDQHAAFAAGLGINVADMLVLNELYKADGQLASALARSVGRAATSFTPALDRLQKKGLICRKPHPKDRRAVLISLTTDGKALRKDIVGHMDVVEERVRNELWKRIHRPMQPSLGELFAPLPE